MPQTIDPVQFDARLFDLYQQHARLEQQRDNHVNWYVHPLARDKQVSHRYGRAKTWEMSDEQAVEALRQRVEGGDDEYEIQLRTTPSQALDKAEALVTSAQELADQIAALEYVYSQDPWTRWFPCLNADGHVHATLRGCPTVRWDTQMGWATELSGTPLETAIKMPPVGLGPRLCSVCFPDAPVEHCRTLRDINRAQREAEKAEREAARYVKRLRPQETFREEYDHGTCETVARCWQLLRNEVEFRNYAGRGPHPNHPQTARDAEQAARVLRARGVQQAEIDEVIARACKKHKVGI
jgi:hypothetical protein